MPKRTDIDKVLIIGSGPIVIGQACEFDYSGTQALKALRSEGYETVLINSNPATIMTDPDMADRTYIEPITPEACEAIIARERPDALLPTMGGQTALNVAVALAEAGVLERHGVEMIGAKLEAIKKAEDRELFAAAMRRIGADLPRGGFARSPEDARTIVGETGFPSIVRPSFTLGGTGGGVARTQDEFDQMVAHGLGLSPISEVLIEESVIGWKEFELEVMRDLADNVVVICAIENVDPMGVHTGDSITVAPAQTLTDRDYQAMRDLAAVIIREIGVETGGSNIQFAVHPRTGRMVVIEMNPRVSRSSALASKATGFPIAKIAAKLAIGLTLDEIANDITRKTRSAFEPTIDYCVMKIPRWTFEKFPSAAPTLTTQMKSVGEVMAIGRTFKEALQKALRSLETDYVGFGPDDRVEPLPGPPLSDEELVALERLLAVPTSERLWHIRAALGRGMTVERVYELTGIDPWFLDQLLQIIETERELAAPRTPQSDGNTLAFISDEDLARAKTTGFGDAHLARLWGVTEAAVRERRLGAGVRATFKAVDTCGAEFEAYTPYFYSTYERESEVPDSRREKILILGSGPNRIGQGIEFDYTCVQAVIALRQRGFETIMVNSNPETVSTDYDTADKLYFEPLMLEHILDIVDAEQPRGIIVQFGGQTPLKVAGPLAALGAPILGTPPDAIDLAEDRERFGALVERLGIRQPQHGMARGLDQAHRIAAEIGYPVLLRPSYVLGGRAMTIVYDDAGLEAYLAEAIGVSEERPVLIDDFLEDALEIDVDAVSDGERVIIGGIMQHIERAGVHSGDSACMLPAADLEAEQVTAIKLQVRALAEALGVVGLMNVQLAIQDGTIFVLEVNPRASRTIPFVSKAIGWPLGRIAALAMVGVPLAEQGLVADPEPEHVAVKESVFPFIKFPGIDSLLGPEMKSTGEVMGIAADFGTSFAKAQDAAGARLPVGGVVFLSVADPDKLEALEIARDLAALGFELAATRGTREVLAGAGLRAELVLKVREGSPDAADLMREGRIALVINTPSGKHERFDEVALRRAAIQYNVPYTTTMSGARAAVRGAAAMRGRATRVRSLQEYHRRPSPAGGT